MKKILIKIGAYSILIFGIILALVVFALGLMIFAGSITSFAGNTSLVNGMSRRGCIPDRAGNWSIRAPPKEIFER